MLSQHSQEIAPDAALLHRSGCGLGQDYIDYNPNSFVVSITCTKSIDGARNLVSCRRGTMLQDSLASPTTPLQDGTVWKLS